MPAPETSEAFRASAVSFRYPDGSPALEGVSFSVVRGERVALLGANGSGKSTLLRLMCGLDFATGGAMEAFGQTLTEEALAREKASIAFRRRVQYVFQNPDVQLFMPTVEEDVAFGPALLLENAEQAKERARETLERLGIGHLAERAPHRLSGGEKHKTAFATALALEPEALLLDEPAAGLDPRSVADLIELLDGFHAAGGTVVMATHDLPLIEEIADRVLLLGEDHRLHADATTREVIADRPLLQQHNLTRERRQPSSRTGGRLGRGEARHT